MKMYPIQNKILCKHYEDHVKAVSQKAKKASLTPFQQQVCRSNTSSATMTKTDCPCCGHPERGITAVNVCALTTVEMAPPFSGDQP
jgi:hypothetical protein